MRLDDFELGTSNSLMHGEQTILSSPSKFYLNQEQWTNKQSLCFFFPDFQILTQPSSFCKHQDRILCQQQSMDIGGCDTDSWHNDNRENDSCTF